MPKKQHPSNQPPVHRAPTKRQLDKWEKQRWYQRIVVWASAAVVGGVLIFVVYGYLQDQVLPKYQAVIKVDDTTYNLGYYTDVLALYAQGQDSSDIATIATTAASDIQYDYLLERGAAELGIKVTETDVDTFLTQSGLPNNQAVRDVVRATLLSNQLRTSYFSLQVPTTADQVDVLAMFLESPQSAADAKARLAKGEDFGALAKELSLESNSQSKSGDLGWLSKDSASDLLGTNVVFDASWAGDKGAVVQSAADDTTSKELGYWVVRLTKIAPDSQARYVSAILLSSLQQANEIRSRLVAGEDFATLAKQYSQDAASKDSGGDLGTLPTRMSTPFKDLVLGMQEGDLSQPLKDTTVQTKGGVWLIKLVDKQAARPLDDTQKSTLVSKAFNTWAQGLLEKATLEDYLDATKLQWAIAHLPKSTFASSTAQ